MKGVISLGFNDKVKIFIKVLLGKEVKYSDQIKCNKVRLGSDYGGWVICPDTISEDSIVYSFGIGEDISFDLELIKNYKCRVFAFDPTPRSIQWLKKQDLPLELYYFDYGISDFDGKSQFFVPENPNHISHSIIHHSNTKNRSINVQIRRLETITTDLGHKHIDILKMDIEGAEYQVIKDILSSNFEIHQILVEFHHRFINNGIVKTKEIIGLLNNNGYKLFNVSSSTEEYSFIKHDV